MHVTAWPSHDFGRASDAFETPRRPAILLQACDALVQVLSERKPGQAQPRRQGQHWRPRLIQPDRAEVIPTTQPQYLSD
jgi:hypothetical protein